MEVLLKNTNIVILASNHNPSIVSKEWLTQRKIIEEEVNKFTHTPIFSLVETTNFTFVVDPDRLQISVKNITPENVESLPRIVERHINQLPETPYTAIGLNYIFHIISAKQSLKDVFSTDEKKFRELFLDNYQLGGVIRFKFDDFLVAINLLPLENDKISADFNFHINSRDIEKIREKLRVYSKAKKKAEEILGGLFNA